MLLLLACVAPRIADRVAGEAACTIHVPADEPDLQEAIDYAFDGDVICVSAGTYTGPFVVEDREIELRGDAATLQGGGGTVLTLLPGEKDTVTVSGFTVSGGDYPWGAGIRIEGNAALSDLVLRDNVAESHDVAGGAGLLGFGGDITLTRVEVRDNRTIAETGVGQGGGLFLGSGVHHLQDVVVSGNSVVSPDDGGGGGIYAEGEVYLQDVRVEENSTSGWYAAGAGIRVDGTLVGRNVLVAGNTLESGTGAGIAAVRGHVGLENATIADNVGGDGLSLLGASATLVNVDISNNDASTDDPGVLSLRHVNLWPDSSASLPNDLSVDPGYVDDYVLGVDSALRDAGDPAILDADGSRSDVGYRGGPDAP